MDYIYSELLDIGKLSWDGLQTSTANVIINNIDSTVAVDVNGVFVNIDKISDDRIKVTLKDRDDNILSEAITDPLNETLTRVEYFEDSQILRWTLDRGTQLTADLSTLASKAYVDENIAVAIIQLLENAVYKDEALNILVHGNTQEESARVLEKSSLSAVKEYVETIFENINLTYSGSVITLTVKAASLDGDILNQKSFAIKDIKEGTLLESVDAVSNDPTYILRLFRESGEYLDIDLSAISSATRRYVDELVAAERARAIAKETLLTNDIAAEISRASAVEETLAANLANLGGTVTDLENTVAAEISRASAAEITLQENIDSAAHSLNASVEWSENEEKYKIRLQLLNNKTESGDNPILSDVTVGLSIPQLSYEEAMEILSADD